MRIFQKFRIIMCALKRYSAFRVIGLATTYTIYFFPWQECGAVFAVPYSAGPVFMKAFRC